MENFKELLFATIAAFISVAIFGVGLIGPLTPSEGMASLIGLLIFWIVPSAIPVAVACFLKNRPLMIGLWSLSVVIFVAYGSFTLRVLW